MSAEATQTDIDRDPAAIQTRYGSCPGCGVWIGALDELTVEHNFDGPQYKTCPKCWYRLEEI